MKKLRVYPIVIMCILLLAIYLPNFYINGFSKRIDEVKIHYSELDDNFIKRTIQKGRKREIVNTSFDDSKKISENDFFIKLPFTYYRYLIKKGLFPNKYMAYAQTPSLIYKEESFLEISSKKINKKSVNLYPLFDSNDPNLLIPEDLFRIDNKGITFLDSSENKINKKKSKIFNDAFKKLGAIFPLNKAYGNPTNRKPFDEGYFISDASGKIFHLKQEENKPFINKVNTNGLEIEYILNMENTRKEYYGLLFDKNGDVYLIMYGEYELVRLPIDKFDYKSQIFSIATNPVNRVITIYYNDLQKEQSISKTFVTNLDYELINKNYFSYSIKQSDLYEKVKSIIFPYKLSLISSNHSYTSFEFNSISKNSFIFYFFISLLYLFYIKFSKRDLKKHMISAVFITTTGIYGIISLFLFNRLFITNLKKEDR